jgi:hypothetical protein
MDACRIPTRCRLKTYSADDRRDGFGVWVGVPVKVNIDSDGKPSGLLAPI